MIYLDNAATTIQKPPEVIQAVIQAMQTAGNAARGAHGGALSAARTVYDARVKVAEFFGCPQPEQVIFTANSTEALNIALFGILQPGDHVVTTVMEHNSVLRPLYALEEQRGIALDFVSLDRTGVPDYACIPGLMRPNTRCVVCTHASNLTGDMVDLTFMGGLAHDHGAMLVVDASQTAGTKRIDMMGMGIDVLCFTGHKGLMGPQGTGGLCIGPGIEIAPWKHGGSGVHSYAPHQPREYPTRLEAGTLNTHGIAGLSAGLDFINRVGLDTIEKKEMQLMRQFYKGVSQIPRVRVYGNFRGDRSAIVTLNVGDYDSGAVADELEQVYGIATRAGAHCAPLMHGALGTREQGAVRFSFSWYNTGEEVEQAIRAVREIAADLQTG